jgi:predicted O-methyltransferase YrrM
VILRTVRNIGANALRPRYLRVMTQKMAQRLVDARHRGEREKATAWAAERAEETSAFALSVAPDLWEEAQGFSRELKRGAAQKLAAAGVQLGGAGHYALLYFLVRLRSPLTVIETGVAAGFSSQAILTALAKNGQSGRLFSSDAPYFRLQSPEQFVGLVVDDDLKANWTLRVDGDRQNIPEILKEVDEVDLLHYDSDKSYEGRQFVLHAVQDRLARDAVVVMDDIQDNLFFRDYVTARGVPYRVFRRTDKFFAGAIGI